MVAIVLAGWVAGSLGNLSEGLVWSDEFNRDGTPNAAKWGYETGFVRNEEQQWYQPQNASVKAGHLIITGRREVIPNPKHQPDSQDWRLNRAQADFSSASLTTRTKFTWTYGRLEVRARFKAQDGLWPAIWALGTGRPWPQCGEVDVMEYYQQTLLANACWANGTWDTTKTPMTVFTKTDPQWDQRFHVWEMDWNADRMRLSVDGRLLNEVDLTKTLNADGMNPFHEPLYLILNLAIGSTGGDPTRADFPAKFEVDYVRIYQANN